MGKKRNINYQTFVPTSIETKVIDITDLSKKEINEKMESELDEYIFKNSKYTFFKNDNNLYVTTFKDHLPKSKKDERAIIPIYSLFKTFTTNPKIINIFASTVYNVVIVYMGKEIHSYNYCLDSNEVVKKIKEKQDSLLLSYSDSKKITIYTDEVFDNIDSVMIYLDDIDIKNIDKTEMIEYKSNLEMLFEKIHIKVKFNLDLKAFISILIKSSLYFMILYMFYQNYNLQKQLDGFYKNLNQDIVKSMDAYQQQLKKNENDSPTKNILIDSINRLKDIDNSIKEIKAKLSTIEQNKNIVLDPNSKPLDNTINALNEVKKDLNSKLDEVSKKDESITYEVLVQSVDYLKIKLNNKVLSLSNDSTTFENLNLNYKNNTLYVNSKSFPLKTKGILKDN